MKLLSFNSFFILLLCIGLMGLLSCGKDANLKTLNDIDEDTISQNDSIPYDTTEVQINGMDVVDLIFSIADSNDMKVISGINLPEVSDIAKGKNGYTTEMADALIGKEKDYITQYQKRYGKHKSFWGWYLGWEENPMKPSGSDKLNFWLRIWKQLTVECHKVHPGSKVTIAPFYVLDSVKLTSLYMPPSDYESVWTDILNFTGIDILMMQESAALHTSFITLADREPYYKAFSNACKKTNTAFWVDMESAQIRAKDWSDLYQQRETSTQQWEFTPINWLSQKLELAAKYSDCIMNWGYFPYMNPITETGPWAWAQNGADTAYVQYKNYYQNIASNPVSSGYKGKPLIRGTLWFLLQTYTVTQGWSKERMKEVLQEQIQKQKDLGFDVIWVTNTAPNMQWAEEQ